jgi:hypothetical protein
MNVSGHHALPPWKTRNPLDRKVVVPQNQSGTYKEEAYLLPFPGFDPQTVQPNDYIPTSEQCPYNSTLLGFVGVHLNSQ